MSHKNNPKKFALNMSAAQFTKFYILHLLKEKPSGMISEHFKKEFKKVGGNWVPAPSTLLDALHDMTLDGLLSRTTDFKSHEKRRQKVYWYCLTDKGTEELEVLKKKYLILFQEQKEIIERILNSVFT
ncbi:PadR family transcriptional regulator [Bacillus sp. SCS-151]|uniref:PadR family transcriptional regulator n=1 Tax=Nanhaiella sioensis TaxID=3115293 RepID=UPI00397841BE